MAKLKESYECSLILANDLIGGKWTLRILWHIIHGDNRFSMLEKAIPEISQKVLSSHLKDLVNNGVVRKEIVDAKPPKTILYHLSEEYDTLLPIIESICSFTKKYAADKNIYVNE